MTDRSVIVKKLYCEGDFTWPLPLAIDPDQLAARDPNARRLLPVPQYCSDLGNGGLDVADAESTRLTTTDFALYSVIR
jgi:hypothetical protein